MTGAEVVVFDVGGRLLMVGVVGAMEVDCWVVVAAVVVAGLDVVVLAELHPPANRDNISNDIENMLSCLTIWHKLLQLIIRSNTGKCQRLYANMRLL